MTFFLGTKGNVRLRRATSVLINALQDQIDAADVNTSLNRLSFDGASENLLTGDRVDISTTDPRGLVCFTGAAWSSGTVEGGISAYVNVNAAGGLRFFRSFADAVNNTRANELALYAFTGEPIPIECRVRDVSYSVLGNVVDYTLATDREAIDTTSLTDKFRQMYSAGLLSGSGTITCAFDYTTAGVTETPLLMLQLIQRLELGSSFDCALYLTDRSVDATVTNVFYQFDAMVTKAGVQVTAGDIINCTIDFVTTGEIRLLIGSIDEYILKEDDDRINLEQSLDFLLKETED
jgi:hypothetical protein